MCLRLIITLFFSILHFNNCKLSSASEQHHQVYCNKNFISVNLNLPLDRSQTFATTVYWQNLNSNRNTEKECQPLFHAKTISFRILLKNLLKCGFQRSVNKLKSELSYSQNIFMQQNPVKTTKININCSYRYTRQTDTLQVKHKLKKRAALLDDFQEDLDIEIVDSIEQKAPEPEVLIEVRQNGELINNTITVIPGTPLVMEVKLNEMANEIYGLSVNYLQVNDMAEMSETILFKGCTVDPYLFENFNFTKKNSLESKFRAFKFPNTAFVQFRANVQVCLKKCAALQCIGGGELVRSRRAIKQELEQSHVIDSGFILKVAEVFKGNRAEFQKLQNHLNLLHIKNLQVSPLK